MKRQIFMYLFIFSLLLILFQYVNSKHILEDKQSTINSYKEKIEKYSDSLNVYQDENFELSLFNLDSNDNSLTYLENKGMNISTVSSFIKDELYDTNQSQADEHPLIPYASMTNDRILIDGVRILNHKWVIASFSDGRHSGEMLINYEINDDKKVDFEVISSFLYPLN